MVLHKRLLAARESMSPRMKMTRFSSSVTATPYLMIRRYNLELLFQKSFCLLHRQHMTKSYQDPTYNFSRRTCLEAAMTILQYQADIRRELHSGDAFHRSKWLATSLEQLDFLMASIIICLGLSSQARRQSSQAHENGEHGVSPYNQLQLLEALRSAHDFLDELKNISKDCQKAYNVISTMLQKFSSDGGSQADAHSPPVYPVPDMDVGMDVRPHPGQCRHRGCRSASSPVTNKYSQQMLRQAPPYRQTRALRLLLLNSLNPTSHRQHAKAWTLSSTLPMWQTGYVTLLKARSNDID